MNRSHTIRSSAENSTESKDQSVTKKSSSKSTGGNAVFRFTDNRPEAVAQRKLQEEAANSSRTKQLKAFAGAAGNDGGSGTQKNNDHNGLPPHLKTGIEDLSGYSMDDVTVHYNSGKPAQLQAHAYAQGNHIHLGAGQEKHLPHEAWHVVQQKQGRVKPTLQLKHGGLVNTDVALEREADRMGQRAMKQSSSVEPGRPVSMPQPMAPGELTIQCVWIKVKKGLRRWEPVTDGVTWFANNRGEIWYKITEQGQVPPGRDYKRLAGEDKKRSWVQWNAISDQPAAAFKADAEYKGSLEGVGKEKTDPEWKKWDSYIDTTIAGAAERDLNADVRKSDPELDPAKVKTPSGGTLSEAQQKTVRAYITGFQIVAKQEFNLRLWEMAEKLAKLRKYSCIISEPGKSNHWITARVLKKVKFLGGSAPQRIISVPAKEKGVMDKERLKILQSIPLDEAAGDIVFLDDGSFSGSQLITLIDNIVGSKPNKTHVGLVASSAKANEQINERRVAYLNKPMPIATFEDRDGLNDVYKAMGWLDEKEHGDHQLGFYSKIADYQSVRYNVVARMKDSDQRTAITGYTESQSDEEEAKRLGITDAKDKPLKGTEPYKALYGKKAQDPIETYPRSGGESKSVPPSAGIQKQVVNKGPLPRPSPGPSLNLTRYSQIAVHNQRPPGHSAANGKTVAPDSKDKRRGTGDVIKVISAATLHSFLKDQAVADDIAKEKEAATGRTVTGSNSRTYEVMGYNDELKAFAFKLKAG